MNNVSSNKPLIIHGIGRSILIYSDGSSLSLPESKDLSIQISSTTGKQEGGDSLYPIAEFVTSKTGKITITDATFSIDQARFALGGTLSQTAEVNAQDFVTLKAGAGQLSQKANVIVDTAVAYDSVTGATLSYTSNSTPSAGQFNVTASGVVKVDSTQVNPIYVNYCYEDNTGIRLDVLNSSVSQPCEFRHHIETDEMSDGKRYAVDIRVMRARCNGSFQYDAKRGEAFSPKLEFNIEDSGRQDKRTLSYNFTEITNA